RLVVVATVAVFLQIVLGAMVRHFGAALQCTDIPLCGGKLWPDGGPAQLPKVHRLGAGVAGPPRLAAALVSLRRRPGRPPPVAPGAIVVLAGQVTLGIYSVLTFLSLWVVVAHLVVGAILLGLMLTLTLAAAPSRAARRAEPAPFHEPARAGA